MITYKKYKIKKGFYNIVKDSVITIPSNITYLTGGSHDVASGLHTGCLHYIGIVKEDYDTLYDKVEGPEVSVTKFNDEYCFITLDDMYFSDEAPEVINPDTIPEDEYLEKLAEWNKQIDFSKYYIAFYSKEFSLIKMANILQINSASDIETCIVYNVNDIRDDMPVRMLEQCIMKLDSFYLHGYNHSIIGKVVEGEIASRYWNKLIYNVIKPFNVACFNADILEKLTSNLNGIDIAHQKASEFIHENKPFDGKLLVDLLEMKIGYI